MGDSGPRTLAIDVGGTGLKAVVLAPDGEMLSERVRRRDPVPVHAAGAARRAGRAGRRPSPSYDRVSVGFPGAIRRGRVRT